MPFLLHGAQSFIARDATEADIRRAFEDDDARGEIVILEGPDGLIQAAGEHDGPYALGYIDKGGAAFDAEGTLTKEEACEAFLRYRRGDPAWRDARRWRRFKPMSAPARVAIVVMALALAALWVWWCWVRLR
ncbi:MAG: hypothetical protein K2W96_28275 [Gemmataceae bacterium]|nr:hypothetical protein [Gemmataceae bacterium]